MKFFLHSTLAAFLASGVTSAAQSERSTTFRHAFATSAKKGGSTTELAPSQRIVGGSEADYDRYPYVVSLVDEFGTHFCGGSLITPDTILTAAHCVGPAGIPGVQIGRHALYDSSEQYETFSVEEFIVHPDHAFDWEYDIPTNDLAVLKLSGQSTFEPIYISPDSSDRLNKAGGEMTVMGWGITSAEEWQPNDVLLETNVDRVPNAICAQATAFDPFWDETVTYQGKISDEMMCAASPGKDACSGDSGSPLIIKGSDASLDVQVGVVSWGFGCADPSFPGVYASISKNMEWIRSATCNSGTDATSSELCGSAAPTISPAPTVSPTAAPTSSPTMSIAPTSSKIFVTVEIGLDFYPEETSWKIKSVPEGDIAVQVLAETYFSQYESVVQTVALEQGREYNFVIADTYGDGIADGYFKLFIGADTADESALILSGKGNEIQYEWTRTFFAGTAAPTASPAPTMSVAPSAAPTEALPYLTLEITFGDYPSDIGWSLRSDDIEFEYRLPGTYWEPNEVVTENIFLPGELSDSTELTFFLVDSSYYDGQKGSYKIYMGAVEDDNLMLSEDNVSGLVSGHTLAIPGGATLPEDALTSATKDITGEVSNGSDGENKDDLASSSGSLALGMSAFMKAAVFVVGLATLL